MVRVFTGLPYAIYNQVLRVKFEEKDLEKKVAKVIDFYKQRDQTFYWVIGPSTSPQNLGNILIDQGLSKPAWASPAMAVDLLNLDKGLFQEAIQRSGIRVNKVESDKELKEWSKFFVTGMGFDEIEERAFYDMSTSELKKGSEANLVHYTAYLQENPVGVSTVAYAAGVAGIYWVMTQKEHRGKDIGTATTLAALFDARERGYEVGVLEATEMGYHVYLRIGFKKYFDYIFYKFPPEEKTES